MALKKKLNVLWSLALYLVASRLPNVFGKIPQVPVITDPKFKAAFVDIHNELRRKVQPPASDMNQVVRKNRGAVQSTKFKQGREMKHGLAVQNSF